ncbi:phosphocarrier protein [Tessaracoccus bendigoensis DSM 12906]|uniref:Phosphocarrier protein HPr n=1 Tax=Tessaracoccus bendigoensis DSM 12906 TaxID=1123357 RepID=A0A1M6II35_9ACTN|nr:HPr family phosphocarrier protein [Tessaracoccus bendigoensis]SHJ34054.1 phosphocarrier protein [Tessaracoccus bendigoensis DSM 12906]
MATRTVFVGSRIGLHARPATMIATAACEYEDEITLFRAGSSVDASSSLLIMTLGAELGAEVTVASENAAAVERIASMIEQDLAS